MSTTTDRVLGANKNQYKAIFTDKKDNSEMDQMDFMKLMVAQMQNQDFTNPMDNSQMVTQMAQFSNMQQMQQMASYAKTNYAMSLIGKTITASRYTVSGNLDTTTGMVQKVSLVDDEYVVYVGGKKYNMAQIMSVQGAGSAGGSTVDPKGYELNSTNVTGKSAQLTWKVPTEDEIVASALKYTVYYSDTDSKFDTVEAVEKGVKSGVSDRKAITTAVVPGLEPNKKYTMNVVVTDENGTKSVYKPVTVRTLRS